MLVAGDPLFCELMGLEEVRMVNASSERCKRAFFFFELISVFEMLAKVQLFLSAKLILTSFGPKGCLFALIHPLVTVFPKICVFLHL